ncbi:MAG: CPXCG motif-containing cysteine-rich protein [Pseudomonadales bacterium]
MDEVAERSVSCPYCGEVISVLVDPQEHGQEYIEDCQVCCRPIVFVVSVDGSEVLVRSENE